MLHTATNHRCGNAADNDQLLCGQAMKLRLQKKRPDLGRREDFYIDETNYPDTGFLPMTLGERQRVLLNIIQSNPVNESLMVDSSNSSGRKAKDPFVAGISIALYRKYKVRAPDVSLASQTRLVAPVSSSYITDP
jgi:hypothetical protein